MSIADHRGRIAQALGNDIPVCLLKQNATYKMYVGLWSAWWYGEAELGGIKVILVTTAANQSNLQDRMALNQIPWFILQLQTLAPEGDSWAQINELLQPDIRGYFTKNMSCV